MKKWSSSPLTNCIEKEAFSQMNAPTFPVVWKGIVWFQKLEGKMQSLMNFIAVVNFQNNSAVLLLSQTRAGNLTEPGKISLLGKNHSGSLVGVSCDFHMASFPTWGIQRKHKKWPKKDSNLWVTGKKMAIFFFSSLFL